MMLAVAIARRRANLRDGVPGARRDGREGVTFAGFAQFLAYDVLFVIGVGSAALGISPASDAARDPRGRTLPRYNAAVEAWAEGGGRAAFANATGGVACDVNGTRVALALDDADDSDPGEPPRVLPAVGVPPRGDLPADVADDRSDVARYAPTAALYAAVPRRDLIPRGVPGVPAIVSVALPRRATGGDVPSDFPDFPDFTADSDLTASARVAFVPYDCSVWSYSAATLRDVVDCDACEGSRCDVVCGANPARAFLARRRWARRIELVAERDEEDASSDASAGSGAIDHAGTGTFSGRGYVRGGALRLRAPAPERCTLTHDTMSTSRAEWASAADARRFCDEVADSESSNSENDAASHSGHLGTNSDPPPGIAPPGGFTTTRDPFSDTLEIVVRSSEDPHVVAGPATGCSYDFGASGEEHLASAAHADASLGCFLVCGYWVTRQRICVWDASDPGGRGEGLGGGGAEGGGGGSSYGDEDDPDPGEEAVGDPGRYPGTAAGGVGARGGGGAERDGARRRRRRRDGGRQAEQTEGGQATGHHGGPVKRDGERSIGASAKTSRIGDANEAARWYLFHATHRVPPSK